MVDDLLVEKLRKTKYVPRENISDHSSTVNRDFWCILSHVRLEQSENVSHMRLNTHYLEFSLRELWHALCYGLDGSCLEAHVLKGAE